MSAENDTVCRKTAFKDLSDQRFGSLLAIRRVESKGRWRNLWLCKCDCGRTIKADAGNLRSGLSKSCGCQRSKSPAWAGYHGRSRTTEYRIWSNIKSRCTNPNTDAYERYGGRGIALCERWQQFANFYADMGPRPSPKHSVDRLDNDGPYSPDNCEWATAKQQSRNARSNRRITLNGQTRTIGEWAEITGQNYHTLYNRLTYRGWTPEEAITSPVRPATDPPWTSSAHAAVHRAIVQNRLPAIEACDCVRCGLQAIEYHHHKGYAPANWLEVVPVCKSCHEVAHHKRSDLFGEYPSCELNDQSPDV